MWEDVSKCVERERTSECVCRCSPTCVCDVIADQCWRWQMGGCVSWRSQHPRSNMGECGALDDWRDVWRRFKRNLRRSMSLSFSYYFAKMC